MDGIISVTLDIILGIKMLELGRVTYYLYKCVATSGITCKIKQTYKPAYLFADLFEFLNEVFWNLNPGKLCLVTCTY